VNASDNLSFACRPIFLFAACAPRSLARGPIGRASHGRARSVVCVLGRLGLARTRA